MTSTQVHDRTHAGGVLTGAKILGIAGMAWTLWGASGLSGAPSTIARITGLLTGVAILSTAMRRQRATPPATDSAARPPAQPSPGSIFSSQASWRVVAIEVVAIAGGSTLLGLTGHTPYNIAWVAAVVGAHFVAFGRLFWTGFYPLAAALLAAATAGTTVGLAGGGPDAITSTTGLIAAASILAAGASMTWSAQAELHPD